MPLMPKRVKGNLRKMHRGNRGGNATSGDYVAFGDYGLQVLTRGWTPVWVREKELWRAGLRCAARAM